jgi:intracellular sulfur oxidation DsrE/DsrF family protein
MQLQRTLFMSLLAVAVVAAAHVGQSKVANADYKQALNGVSQVKAVFDVSQASANTSNLIFWAVRNVYQDSDVKGLAKPPKAAVVFHGPAVRLLSTDKKHYKRQNQSEVAKFHTLLRQMKADGVKLEVCKYALKVLKVDPKSVIPEIDRVGNGFVSIVGYQAQGYHVVRIP